MHVHIGQPSHDAMLNQANCYRFLTLLADRHHFEISFPSSARECATPEAEPWLRDKWQFTKNMHIRLLFRKKVT